MDTTCPACALPLDCAAQACPACGADLTLWADLQGLRAELGGLRRDTVELTTRLRDVHGRLDRFVALATRAAQPRASPLQAGAPAGEHPAATAQSAGPQAARVVGLDAAVPGPAHAARQPAADPAEAPPAAASDQAASRDFVPAHPSSPADTHAESAVPDQITTPAATSAELAFGQKWLLLIGVVIVVLGVAFGLKYSFDQNLIGPAVRVALGYAAALALLGVGEYFRRRIAAFGLSLIGGGIAVMYFSTFAAFQLYSLIDQAPAFGLMVVITVFAGVLALVYDTVWLAVLGLIGGFLTPPLLSTGSANQLVLMSYATILNGGVLAISAFKRWRLLMYLGFVCTWALFIGFYSEYYAVERFWMTLGFCSLFFLIYALVPYLSFLVRSDRPRLEGFAITIPNAFVAFGFSFEMIERQAGLEWVALASLAYAALFIAMAARLHRRGAAWLNPALINLGMGITFLIVTVPVLFSGQWITAFWAAQAVVLIWLGLALRSHGLHHAGLALLLVSLAKYFLYDLTEVFAWSFDEQWAARLATGAVALACLWAARRLYGRATLDWVGGRAYYAAVLQGLLVALLFLALNLEVARFTEQHHERATVAALSVLWALYAIALMVLGFVRSAAIYRRVAIGLFAATILKVFLIDMANVATPFRILSFIVLGLLLVGASYLYYRFADRLLPAPPAAPSARPAGAERGQ